jgi:L-glyceraldehyde 3-phosphate reductase
MQHTPSTDRYQSMLYNRCGKSGLMLPAISLGLWHNFGGVDPLENAREMIHRAFDLGITHFDLANNYGPPPGSAEHNLGRILADGMNAYRDEMIISTKAGYRMWPGPYGEWGSRKYMIASLDQSLKRMGIDYVDIFYSHRPDPDTPLTETMAALDHAVRQGKALYAGISSYDAEQTRQAAEILRDLGTPCIIHQPSYSILNRWIEGDLQSAWHDTGMGAIAFCPLAQGLLTDKYLSGTIPKGSRADKPHGFLRKEQINQEKLERIGKLNAIAESRGQTLAQMALAWVLRKGSGITSALIGASRVEQIEENVQALDNLEFSNDELTRIDSA